MLIQLYLVSIKFLEKHDSFIVLEDDLEVSSQFLNFMNKTLKRYEDEKNIWTVNGMGFNNKLFLKFLKIISMIPIFLIETHLMVGLRGKTDGAKQFLILKSLKMKF